MFVGADDCLPSFLLQESVLWSGRPLWRTPFDQIQLDHYRPAFEAAMKKSLREGAGDLRYGFGADIRTRSRNSIAAATSWIRSQQRLLLDEVVDEQRGHDSGQDIAAAVQKHADEIRLNDLLFQRVRESVYEEPVTKAQPGTKRSCWKDLQDVRPGVVPISHRKKGRRLKEINSRLPASGQVRGERPEGKNRISSW